ncbi:putative calcium channel [Echria macrotheca]|uniref:Calcium channel n=1 Tax=Echria macrotheca TaxID=438768 RepID=A0AAJ0BH74_9PEZI|nr:putative calcium channel [Echria macrotheca]
MGDGSTGRRPTGPSRSRSLRIQEPERRPLLQHRVTFNHELDRELFSCHRNAHSHLPVYTNIHRIRRDIVSVVEDYLSLDQLRDVRINISVVRPLVDKLYEQDDISIVYCLLVNRAQFLNEQSHLKNRQNVNYTRAMLCELVATRILRRFNEDNEGPENLMVLAHILIAGFEPFQNAPEEVRREVESSLSLNKTLPALEVAILTGSRHFLSSTSCQKVVDAIYVGRVIYTPSSYMDLISDHYKQRPISLYEPREAPLLNQYRLVVPRTRNILEIMQFVILLGLYLAFMAERDPTTVSKLEICFVVYALGWVLDQFATILEHGWRVYTQNLWSFLDVTFAIIYWVYLIMRIYGLKTDSVDVGQQALDVLAMGAPVLIPRLAFNLLSDNMLFLSLRSMMKDFALLTALACWCFVGFLLSLLWLGNGEFPAFTISKWMIYIWFGLDGSGIHYSTEFHQILGPALMVTFAFLGNTLFLTVLVSMLSTTFSKIMQDATAEIQFRRAVLTLEGVKGDAIFAYQPPFNLLAIFILIPLKFLVSPRWFHKIHVFWVRFLNLPLLLIIAVAERRVIWPDRSVGSTGFGVNGKKLVKPRAWFWEKWRWSITSHSDLETVFEVPPPDSVLSEIATDDELTRHMIRRQFTRHNTLEGAQPPSADGQGGGNAQPKHKTLNRRDSIAPFPGLRAELHGLLSESDEVSGITSRLEALEESTQRIEAMLTRLADGFMGSELGSTTRDHAHTHAWATSISEEEESVAPDE